MRRQSREVGKLSMKLPRPRKQSHNTAKNLPSLWRPWILTSSEESQLN